MDNAAQTVLILHKKFKKLCLDTTSGLKKHTQIQLSEVFKTNIKINIILIRWPSIEDLKLFAFSLITARGTTPLWNLIVLQFSLLRLGTGSTYIVDDQSCDKRDTYVDSDLYKIFWIYFY